MKLHLSDEKTYVDPCPHIGVLLGLNCNGKDYSTTVKLGLEELLNKEQIGNIEPFPATNLPVYLIYII